MAGVEQIFDRIDTVALFALHDVLLGEHEVVDDRAGICPGAKQVIAFEEAVVPVAGGRLLVLPQQSAGPSAEPYWPADDLPSPKSQE